MKPTPLAGDVALKHLVIERRVRDPGLQNVILRPPFYISARYYPDS